MNIHVNCVRGMVAWLAQSFLRQRPRPWLRPSTAIFWSNNLIYHLIQRRSKNPATTCRYAAHCDPRMSRSRSNLREFRRAGVARISPCEARKRGDVGFHGATGVEIAIAEAWIRGRSGKLKSRLNRREIIRGAGSSPTELRPGIKEYLFQLGKLRANRFTRFHLNLSSIKGRDRFFLMDYK